MKIECTLFDERLMDLVYNELDEETAEAMRSHASTCATCGDNLEKFLMTRKMTGLLEMPEPPAFIDDAVLDAAAESVRQSDVVVEMPVRSKPAVLCSDEYSVTWGRLRAVLLKPAFATAAGAALVLVVTLFLSERSSVLEEQSAPSIPSMLRESGRGAGPEEDIVFPPAHAAGQPPVAEKSEQMASKSEGAKKLGMSGASPEREQIETPASRARVSPRKRSAATSQNLGTRAVPPPAQVLSPPSSVARKSKAKGMEGAGAGFDEAPFASAGEPAFASPPKKEAKRGLSIEESEMSAAPVLKDGNGTSDYEQGMAAFHRGDCEGAKAAFLRVINQSDAPVSHRSKALHHLAKCEKRRGRCGRALPYYERVIAEYPAYRDRPSALFEAATCRRRLGNMNGARQFLQELSRIAGWEKRAKEAMDKLNETP